MAEVDRTLPSLMNGVSQQAVSLRQRSQAEVQINGFSSIVDGVGKRPPTKNVAKISDGVIASSYVHTINRDDTEQYTVFASNGQLKVYDITGDEKTVSYPNGTGYLSSVSPADDFRMVTVADSTFVVNRSVTVATDAALSVDKSKKGIVFIKQAEYEAVYRVRVDNTQVATYTAPGTSGSLSVDNIRDNLVSDMNTSIGATFTITADGPSILIERTDGADFELDVSDSSGTSLISAIKGEVQSFTDLPATAFENFSISVVGSEESEADTYYVEFRPNSGTSGEGVWVETLASNIEYALNDTTMPHTLKREADGSFTFAQADWGGRVAGDLDTAPWPSFVGSKINDVYFDRNRFCVLSNDNVIMTRARKPFDFFPETVLQVLDDGPIDVRTPGSKVTDLQYAIPFNKAVALFSSQAQYVIEDEKLLASSPPAIKEMTAFASTMDSPPVAAGRTVYFGSTRGQYTSVLEYYLQPESDTTDAVDVTRHVPTYIPSGLFKLASSASSDLVLSATADAPNLLYVYKYFWQREKKLQSSWSYWEFDTGATILNVDFINDVAYLVIQYADGVYLESLDVSEGQTDPEAPYVILLDRRVDETATTMVYDSNLDRTTITLPYIPSTSLVQVVSRFGALNDRNAATKGVIVSVSGNDVVVEGDWRSSLFYAGQTYVSEYEFSTPVMTTQGSNGAEVYVAGGRLQIGHWTVVYSKTGYFRAEVEPRKGGQVYTKVFTGKTLGTQSSVIGESNISSGEFRFSVKGKSDQIRIRLINDSFLPSNITSARWEGTFDEKAGRQG